MTYLSAMRPRFPVILNAGGGAVTNPPDPPPPDPPPTEAPADVQVSNGDGAGLLAAIRAATDGDIIELTGNTTDYDLIDAGQLGGDGEPLNANGVTIRGQAGLYPYPQVQGSFHLDVDNQKLARLRIHHGDHITRSRSDSGSSAPGPWDSHPITVEASNTVIDRVHMHNCATNPFQKQTAKDVTWHGVLSFLNGWLGSDRGHGHGYYNQSTAGVGELGAIMTGCMGFSNFHLSEQWFTTNGSTHRHTADDCFFFNGPALHGPVVEHKWTRCVYWQSAPTNQECSFFNGDGTQNAPGLEIRSCLFVGGLHITDQLNPIIRNNEFWRRGGTGITNMWVAYRASASQAQYDFDDNTYWQTRDGWVNAHHRWQDVDSSTGTYMEKATWQALSFAPDPNSTFNAGAPSGFTRYYVIEIEADKMWYVAVWNPDETANTTLPQSPFGSGNWRVWSAQNPFTAGTVYPGPGPSVPMSGWGNQAMLGTAGPLSPSNPNVELGPEFQAFVVRKE